LDSAVGGSSGISLESERLYFWPLGQAAEAAMERVWRGVAPPGAAAPAPAVVPVLFGREVVVQRSAGGAAWVRGRGLVGGAR
jgi:predicted ATPase